MEYANITFQHKAPSPGSRELKDKTVPSEVAFQSLARLGRLCDRPTGRGA